MQNLQWPTPIGKYLVPLTIAIAHLAGCANFAVHIDRQPQSATRETCRDWLYQLDEHIDVAGVRDVEAQRLPGHPHLRSNRFLASFAAGIEDKSATFQDWLQAMRDLDQVARDIEIRNLPAGFGRWPRMDERAALLAEVRRCAGELADADSIDGNAASRLRLAAAVRDAYSTSMRAVGLYTLTSIPFLAGVNRWQE